MPNVRLGLWWLFATGLVGGLLVVLWGSVRVGGDVVAGILAAAGMARLLLPARRLGGLVVRSRVFDAIVLLGLAAATLTVVTSLDLTPP